jgi:antirestriction protein ArdC
MSTNNSASKAVNKILEAFETGNLPQAIAFSTFTTPANIPAYKWTQRNRALAFLQGTGDARGYQQWTEAGRHVKKGSKSVYILGPILKKSNQVMDIFDEKTGETQHEEIMECVGYHAIPVFRVEDTEGKPLEYLPLDVKTLPLADIAARWGIEVKAGAFNGEYAGYYCDGRKEIVMATDSEKTFLHELAHAAHYRIDTKAEQAPSWAKEVIAELSAAALMYMLGKEPPLGNNFQYIKGHAEEANLSPVKACMKILDTCLKVINEIVQASETQQLNQAA